MVGYILLTVGIIAIVLAGFSVYQVFTKQAQPVQLFNFEGVSLNMGSLMGDGEGMTAEQKVLLEKQKSQVKPQEIVSSAMINDTSNIAAHMFLMGFVVSIGYRIASLGIQLLRPIKVQMRESTSAKPLS